jgi:hypothetical protein
MRTRLFMGEFLIMKASLSPVKVSERPGSCFYLEPILRTSKHFNVEHEEAGSLIPVTIKAQTRASAEDARKWFCTPPCSGLMIDSFGPNEAAVLSYLRL